MKSKVTGKQKRKQYSPEFKQQALLRAEQDGVAVTAAELGLNDNQIYA